MDMQNKPDTNPDGDTQEKQVLSRRKFLRISAVGVLGAAASGVVAACAPTSLAVPTAAPATAAAGATAAAPVAAPTVLSGNAVTVKVMSNWWVDPGFQKQLRAVASKFQAAQNDIKIEEVGVSNAQFVDTLKAQEAAGKIDSDIIIMLPGTEPPLLAGGFIGPLNDIIAKTGIGNTKIAQIVPPFLRKGDQIYGLPANLAVDGLMYNMDILKKAGVSTTPKTQDDFLALAKSLTNRPNQFGYAVRHTVAEKTGFIRDMIPWVLGYDGAYAVGKTPTINAEPMINVLKKWRDFYVDAFPQGADAATYRRMMATGLLAMNTDNNALIPTFVGIEPKAKDYITSAPLPWANHKGAQFSNHVAVVNSGDTTKQQAANAFVEYWYTPANFKEWNWAILSVPMIPEADTKEYINSLPWMGGFATTVPVHNSIPYGDFFPYQAEFTNILIQHASEVVTGTVTPEAGAAAAQTELEDLGKRVFS